MSRALALLRLVLALGALTLVLSRPQPAVLTLYPLVPPLTRVDGLGDHTLGPPVAPPPSPGGAPAARAVPALRAKAQAGRLAVSATAQRLAVALGPQRVAAAVHAREQLSAQVGEGAVWAALAAAVPNPTP